MIVSRKVIDGVKLSHLKSYEIAHLAGLHPSTLSRLIHGIDRIKPHDHRVVKVGKVLGLIPDDCFDQKAA